MLDQRKVPRQQAVVRHGHDLLVHGEIQVVREADVLVGGGGQRPLVPHTQLGDFGIGGMHDCLPHRELLE